MFSYIAIPCTDFNRAFKFYYTLTDGLIQRNPNVPFPMAYFLDKENHNLGHLFQHPNFAPSKDGTIVYLGLNKDIASTIKLIEAEGGSVVMPKTLIAPDKGYWALFLDTEGNKLALHSYD